MPVWFVIVTVVLFAASNLVVKRFRWISTALHAERRWRNGIVGWIMFIWFVPASLLLINSAAQDAKDANDALDEFVVQMDINRVEDCKARNDAWERAMGFLLTVSQDDELIESLRRIGSIDCASTTLK